MNKVIMFLVVGLFCSCGLVFADSWHIETVDTGTGTWEMALYTSIALDSSNNPHISYWEYDIELEQEHLKYARWDGYHWARQLLDTLYMLIYSISNTSIALDSSDNPHILYYASGLKYAHWTGSIWDIQGIWIGSRGYPSIALDSSDNPHISCWGDLDLKYAHWTGSTWEVQVVDADGNVGLYTSIALDSLGNPHISYYDGDTSNCDLKYAHWTGSIWEIQAVDTTGSVGLFTSIAVDSSDNPHISYYDWSNDDLKYARWTGTTWEIQSVDTTGDVGGCDSIALDSSDNPHISYLDETNYDLKYAYWTGSTWEIQSVDTEGAVGGYTSIALDSSDNPHISYCDFTNNGLKYAWYGPDTSINLLSFTATPQEDSSVLLDWQVEATPPMAGGEQIAGFNLYRREINNDNDIAAEVSNLGCIWTKVNPSLITGQNPYTYTDTQVEPGKSYEYKLEAVLADESTEILGTANCAPAPPAFAITKVYPNPASDVLNVILSMPQACQMTLELYDLTGRVVASKDIQVISAGEFSEKLDVSGLANGIYVLRANQGSLSASERAVVAR